MNMRQLMQRITYSFYLYSIAKEELPRYLAFRLLSAGHEDGQLFTESACKLLYKISRGWPRILNIIADKSMLAAYAKQSHIITKKMVYFAIQDSFHIIDTTNNTSLHKKCYKMLASLATNPVKKSILIALAVLIGSVSFNYLLYVYLLS